MLVVGIFGSSGSGKTTIASDIANRFNAVIVNMDNFYHNISLDMPERDKYIDNYNFDVPEAIQWNLLKDTIHKLKYGPVDVFEYDFNIHTHSNNVIRIDSTDSDYIIVEGIHAWMLADICDLLIYVNTDLDECFRRRLQRDMKERGRTDVDGIVDNWDKKVKPAFHKYIIANEYRAHVKVRNEHPHKISHMNVLYSVVECLGKYPMPEIVYE